jgi:hypothetical protein
MRIIIYRYPTNLKPSEDKVREGRKKYKIIQKGK